MKKLFAILLSIVTICSLVACDLGDLIKGEPIEHDASKVKGNIEALAENDGIMLELAVSFEGTGEVDEATAEKIVYAQKGGLFYISNKGEEVLIDTRDAEKAYIYTKVEGEGWIRETLIYSETDYSLEDINERCDQYSNTMFGYLTMYSKHASIPMEKTSAVVAGRECDKYSFSLGVMDYSIDYSLSIDQQTGICLEWKFSGQAGEAGSANVAFICTAFETPYEIEIPTDYTDRIPEIDSDNQPEVTE